MGAWTTLPSGPAVAGRADRRDDRPVLDHPPRRRHLRGRDRRADPRRRPPSRPRSRARRRPSPTALEVSIREAPEQWCVFKPMWPDDPAEEAALAARAPAMPWRGRAEPPDDARRARDRPAERAGGTPRSVPGQRRSSAACGGRPRAPPGRRASAASPTRSASSGTGRRPTGPPWRAATLPTWPRWLAANGRGSARARAAATDPAALERLVRAAFRHGVRDVRGDAAGHGDAPRDVRRHLVIEHARRGGCRLRAPGPIDLRDASTSAPWWAWRPCSPTASWSPSPRRWRPSPIRSSSACCCGRASVGGAPDRGPARGPARAPRRARSRRGRGARGRPRHHRRRHAGHRSSACPRRCRSGPPTWPWRSGAPLHVAAVRRVAGGAFRGWLVDPAAPARRPARRARIEALLASRGPGIRGPRRARAGAVVDSVFYPDLGGRRPAARGAPRRHRPGERLVSRPSSAPCTARTPRSRTAAPTSTSTRSPRTASAASRRSSPTSWRARELDVIAIADHERVDAAHAARAIARARELPSRSSIGEEVSTRGGHLLALFIEEPIPPLRSLRDDRSARSTSRVASPSRPTRSSRTRCAPRRWTLRRLLAIARIRASGPTPWRRSTPRRSGGRSTAASSPSRPSTAWPSSATATPTRRRPSGPAGRRSRAGRPRIVRAAILARRTGWHGSFHGTASPAPDLRPAAPQVRPRHARRGRRAGSGATAPGATSATRAATRRPPRLDESAIVGAGEGRGREDRPGHALRLPAAGRRQRPRRPPLREPPRARPRRPDPDRQPRPAAHAPRATSSGSEGLPRAGQRLGRDDHGLAALPVARSRTCWSTSSSTCSTSTSRSCPSSSLVDPARVAEREHRHVPRLSPASRPATSWAGGCCGPSPRAGSTAGSRSAPPRATSPTATCPGDYKVIPNGVDLLRFAHAVPIARWQDGRPNILFVGRLEPRKGLLHLLKALPDPAQGRLATAGSWSSAPGRRSARRAATS